MERRVPDLVLSDTRLTTPATVTSPLTPRDGYDFCERLQANEAWARVPFMFLTGSVDLNDKIRGLRLGVEDYLTKPIYLKELLTRVQLVLARRRRESLTAGSTRASFAGELGGMGLIDLLTTVDLGRKTGLLEIDASPERGSLTFRDGQVIDAATGVLRGERAVYRMLRWNDGSFTARFGASVLDGVTVETTITMGIQGLMLEGLRRADEWNHLESSFAPLDGAWEIDRDALTRAVDSLDPLAVSLAERIDGRTTLAAILEACNDDLAALTAAASLRDKAILRRFGEPASLPTAPVARPPTVDFDTLDQLFSEPESPPAATHTQGAAVPVVSVAAPVLPPPVSGTEGAVVAPPNLSPTPGRPTDDRRNRSKTQEHHVSKHKGKRQKGKQDNAPQSRPAPPQPAAATGTSRESPVAQAAATAVAQVEAAVESGLRVEGNVIHLPAADTAVATNDSSGAHPTPRAEKAPDADVSALREAVGERERTTVPPAEAEAAKAPTGDEAKPEGPARSFFDPSVSDPPKADAKAEAPAEEKKVEEKKADAPKSDDKKVDAKKAEEKKADAKKGDDKKADAKKGDTAVAAKGASGRERKESLSSHLSDEARAFFSEQAYQAAYKTDHDTFEDLVPAAEEHARETARSRQWMKISGGVVAAIVAVSVGFAAWHSQYAVRETTLLASRPTQPATLPEAQVAPTPEPTPAPAPEPAPPAAAPTPEPTAPAAAPTPEPAAPAAAPTPEPTPTPPAAGPTVAAPPVAAPPVAAPTVAAPVPTAPVPTAPAAAPAGAQTPQQLLAAARNFRGAMPGRVAAYETYFNAAPADDRTMTTFAMSLAEMGRAADAERIATRAVTANANNAQAWFIVAFSRKTQRNAAGFTEARTRCIALGGQWATECRALQ
jgi:CheY-like chemotaxis protein